MRMSGGWVGSSENERARISTAPIRPSFYLYPPEWPKRRCYLGILCVCSDIDWKYTTSGQLILPVVAQIFLKPSHWLCAVQAKAHLLPKRVP